MFDLFYVELGHEPCVVMRFEAANRSAAEKVCADVIPAGHHARVRVVAFEANGKSGGHSNGKWKR